MDGTEVMEVEDFGAMATAFRNDEVEALMKMTGQGAVQKEKVGLPRLNINYEAENILALDEFGFWMWDTFRWFLTWEIWV